MKQWLDTSKLARNAAGVSHSCGKWYCCHSNPALDCNIGYVRHTTLPCATLYWLYACICSAIQCSANPICHVSGLLHSALHTNNWMHKPKLSASLSFPLWPDLQWHLHTNPGRQDWLMVASMQLTLTQQLAIELAERKHICLANVSCKCYVIKCWRMQAVGGHTTKADYLSPPSRNSVFIIRNEQGQQVSCL